MKRIFRKLQCHLFGHQWFAGPSVKSNGLDCVRCKEHRPWMNLDIEDYFPKRVEKL
jgi:hypothetical protein